MPDINTKEFEFPKADEHVSVIGRTGSGKTQAGAWLLSNSDLNKRPCFIFDWKREKLLNSIEKAQHTDPSKDLPRDPGLYIIHMMPDNFDQSEALCWQIYDMENCCVYVDEATMMGRNNLGYKALLTQGRSKNVNLISLNQRPTDCSRSVFSEASHFMVFQLNDERDKKIIEGFTKLDLDAPLAPYHSLWYDVKRDLTFPLLPVPEAANILKRFDEKLPDKPRPGSVNKSRFF